MEYSVVISYSDPNDASNIVSLILDSVEDTTINARSTVTEHPTMYGTSMADHMYKEPIELSLRGTFSLNGKKGIVVDKGGQSLARVEEMFEEIKNLGIICTITKIKVTYTKNTDGTSTRAELPQFTVRKNMVLQSIGWTEKINSLDFSFSFKEALRADVQLAEADPDDAFAPNINYAEASNFSDTLLDWEAVDREVIQSLFDFKLIAAEFLEHLSTLTTGSFVAIGAGVVIALALTKTLIALGMAASTIPVVGAVIAGAIAITIGIFALVKKIKQSAYRIKAFAYYKNPKKRDKETDRFVNFYEDIHNQIRSLDKAIKVWSITENKPQETLLNIDGSYYIFNFEKNNLNNGNAYNLNVYDINDVSKANTNTNKKIDSFLDGTDTNFIFETDNSFVYLVCPEGLDVNDLTNYLICATTIRPTDFNKVLSDIIVEAIRY